jgi:hypothetical protein
MTDLIVDVFEDDDRVIETDVDYRDYVPEHEQADARYNLDKYGRYWVYHSTGINHCLRRRR